MPGEAEGMNMRPVITRRSAGKKMLEERKDILGRKQWLGGCVACDGEDLGMLKMEVRNGGRKEERGTTTFTKTRKK